MADFSGLITKPAEFGAFDQTAEGINRATARTQQLAQQAEARKAASGTFVKNYLDSKDFLTGTNYDPEIVKQLQGAMQQGAALAAKGADTPSIMMALGPTVNKLNEYSTKAKLVDKQIKESLGRMKGYKGYNIDALEQEAKRLAFQDEKGALKDISKVDPNIDFVTEAVKLSPDKVTTGAGFDDFVNRTPMAEYSRDVQTAYAGKTRNVGYEARHPFWMDLQKDDKGGIAVDASGNPLGLDVVGSTLQGDDGKPLINPETKQPYKVVDKNIFNAIMKHNPDIADFVRGQVVSHFRDIGAEKIPAEDSPQWEAMARAVVHDELKTRDKSFFKPKDKAKESAAAIKIDIGQNPEMLAATKAYADANRKAGGGDDLKDFKVNPVDAIGRVMTNDPEYTGGERKTVAGRNVIDVTSALPGGGLKKGRGEDEVYKSVYYDPAKRELIVEEETTDKFGEKTRVPTVVKEANVGQFMRKIAEANNVPLTAVRTLLDNMGYKDGKFTKVNQAPEVKEPPPPPRKDASKLTFKDMKGIETPEGTVTEVDERSALNPRKWGGDSFYVNIKDKDGKTIKKTFPTREKLNEYLNQEKKQQAPAQEKSATTGGDWRSRAKKVQ